MIKFIWRTFTSRESLRKLNREMRFLDVKQIYEEMSVHDEKARQQWKPEYLYALKFIKYTKQLSTPTQAESLLRPTMFIDVPGNNNSLKFIFNRILKLGIFLVIGYLFTRIFNKSGGDNTVYNILNSVDHIHVVNNTNVKFSDVKGIDDCRAELEEIVEYLKNPTKYLSVGAKMLKGVLLTGRPGTGKTLLAKAIAGEAGVAFFYCSGSDFEEMLSGIGAKRVRELFRLAKANTPCIIFIDEIDAIGGKRSRGEEGSSRQTLNQILCEMDGFKPNHFITVIGATNFPESLDKALKRAGRFDKIIDVPLPDLQGRTEIVQLYLDKIVHQKKIDPSIIARKTMGMTGADIANIINIAALHAVKEGGTVCLLEDIDYAIDRVKIGIEIRSYSMSEEEIMNTAYHEVGHALVAYLTKGTGDLHKITILPRGPSLGHTSILDTKENREFTRQEIMAQLDMLMGGRAAEEVFFGKQNITSGCASDLKHATRMAYEAIKTGMFGDRVGYAYPQDLEQVSDSKRNEFDRTVSTLLSESYERAIEILCKNKDLVNKLAATLRENETLTKKQFDDIVKGVYTN